MKKGFTLIELLAVIVILAIIALIAVPIVLNIINNSKESAKIRSSELYLDAVKNSIASSQLGDNQIANGTYEIMSDGNICLGTITDGVCDNTLEVSVDGEIPDSGTITITNGKITDFSLYYGTDKVAKDETGNLIYEENMVPGLYDKNGKLLATWDELITDYGVDVETNYTNSSTNSPAKIINNKFPEATKLVVGGSSSVIGNYVFANSTNLISIEIPLSVTSIGAFAFFRCSNLTSVNIPSSVTSIGNYAYSQSTNLKSIEIPSSVTSIGVNAFYECSGLETIKVDSNNTVYDSRNNSNVLIETATNKLLQGSNNGIIPSGVISIGDNAFRECEGLTSIQMPDSVTTIGKNVFYGCTNLKNVKLSSTLINIGFMMFYKCTSLASVEIPNSVTSIEGSAFSNCSSLTSVTIPSNVTSIGTFAFGGCSSVESIVVDENNTVYNSGNNSNAIIETATNTLITGCKNTVIPSDITSIGASAFSGCTGLTSISIPNTVTSIGNNAFSACSNLTSVEILGSVTSIGTQAFYNCINLPSIEIPETVTSIGTNTFLNCEALTTIYYKGTAAGSPWGAPSTTTIVTDF